MSDKRYLDDFTDKLKESDFNIDGEMKQRILNKTYRKIRRRWFPVKIAAACLIFAVLLSFIPETPVYALRQKLFSFIPGVGVVENNEETGVIKSVLEKPVKVNEGNKFVEIDSAYVIDKMLHVSIRTNIGAVNAGEFNDVKEFKKYFSEKSVPNIYIIKGNQNIKPGFLSCGGPSYETRVYEIAANFSLESIIENKKFEFRLEGFDKIIKIEMASVHSDTDPQNIGNAVAVGNIMIFANTSRQGDNLNVLVSAVAPEEYKNIRFHLFDWERKVFKEGIHIVDEDGIVYEPNDNTFSFNIPQDKKGLKLVIPQILYDREYNKGDIKIKMPEINKEVSINKEINWDKNTLKVEKASIIPADHDLLPENFKEYNCLKIDFSAEAENGTKERICRVLPDIEVSDGVFGYIKTSSGSYADLWSPKVQKGYSITEFEVMEKTKKIMLNLDIECQLEGEWEIELD